MTETVHYEPQDAESLERRAGLKDTIARWLGDPGYERLPERVRKVIAAQQDHSEILIGWIQLAVVLTFGTLYILAPKTFTEEASFAPVPWVLSAYLAFTILRLALAYHSRLPGWFLGLSVVTDMALLLGMMWSFHLQYEQPPSFYLKAPTLLYVFIFIALRALRFDAGYVILAGLVAALGWVLMVLYVIFSDPADSMITRDYVQYMTSNSVLLGAEFDKIVSILVVTAIIAVALARARRLLVRSVAEDVAHRDLSRFFAPEIAEQITTSEQEVTAGTGEIREAAILMVDVRDFTGLASKIPPSELIALLAEYQSRVVPVIRRHGGSIDKFLGDGIMATFGAAVRSRTFAADALRAADEITVAARAWDAERAEQGRRRIIIGSAVATGRVVFGAVGDETRLEYTVIGEAVNLAAKLEKHNKTEGIRAVTTAVTYNAARAQGYIPSTPPEERMGRKVAGVDRPLDLVVLAT